MGRYSGKTCRLIFMLVLTVGFFVAELVSGYLGNSIALVSDSFNMLSDLISLCVGLSTGRIARRSRRGPRATYGYSRAEAKYAAKHFAKDTNPLALSSGVLLHVMGDALGSVVVVITATIFYVRPLGNAACNWQCYIDPSLTIIMVIIILSSAFPLIKETSTILLQMVPKGVNIQILTDRLARIPGVSSLHEVHVWELASGKNIATLHVKCQTPADYQDAAHKIREIFHEAGVHSVTIQPEYVDHKTSQLLCSSPCISKACDSQLCCSQREPPRAKTNGYTEKNNSCISTGHRDNGSSKSDIEIPIEDLAAEDSLKNCDISDDKSQTSSTRF
ncbi:solute carrier family 30 member 10 [Pitangus sulphuratus]|nr:solute carrier family 30 member 10 [Pitangus sulphuratus]